MSSDRPRDPSARAAPPPRVRIDRPGAGNRRPALAPVALVLYLLAGGAGAQPSEGDGSDGAAGDRVADGPGGLVTGNEQLELTISGQVDRAVLVYDDGDDTGTLFVDNDNSSTRIRFVTESRSFSPATLGGRIEVEFQSNPSNLVSQSEQEGVGDDSFDERKFEVYAKSDTFGQLLLGQGSTASDGTAETDLSGTGVAGYSDVDDTGGGLFFRSEGTLTDVNVASVFGNFDGLGRDDRLRYDAPTVADFTLSFSAASDEARDVALRWQRDRDPETWSAAAAVSYSETGNGDGDADGDAGDGNADEIGSRLAGSASVLLGGGWNLTLAGGRADADDRDPSFGYVKLGRRFAAFELGQTRVSIDYHRSVDVARPGEEATSIGLGLVQRIDRFEADVFAAVRTYRLDAGAATFAADAGGFLPGLDAGSRASSIDVAMIGLRVPF